MSVEVPEDEDRVVLVVDDDEASRRLIVRWLTGGKLACIEAADGEAALKIALADPDRIQAIVLDVMMPGLDGFGVLQRIKQHPEAGTIPIVVLTAHANNDEDVVRGVEAGAVDYLAKPFSGPVLVAKVRAAAVRGKAERKLRRDLSFAEETATTDGLTGLHNRRAFEERLREMGSYAVREREYFSLVMVDIDHFKRINDSYGHPEGDRALVQMATALRSVLRTGDGAYRYGGEEFALLLRKCEAPDGVVVAERLHTRLREMPLELVKGETHVLTFSAGVASAAKNNGYRWHDIVERADAALYRAKHGGRDRTEVDG